MYVRILSMILTLAMTAASDRINLLPGKTMKQTHNGPNTQVIRCNATHESTGIHVYLDEKPDAAPSMTLTGNVCGSNELLPYIEHTGKESLYVKNIGNYTITVWTEPLIYSGKQHFVHSYSDSRYTIRSDDMMYTHIWGEPTNTGSMRWYGKSRQVDAVMRTFPSHYGTSGGLVAHGIYHVDVTIWSDEWMMNVGYNTSADASHAQLVE